LNCLENTENLLKVCDGVIGFLNQTNRYRNDTRKMCFWAAVKYIYMDVVIFFYDYKYYKIPFKYC